MWPDAPTSAAQLSAASSGGKQQQHHLTRLTDQALTTHVHRQLLSPRIAARYSCSRYSLLLTASTFAAPLHPQRHAVRCRFPEPPTAALRIAACASLKQQSRPRNTHSAHHFVTLCHAAASLSARSILLLHTVASPIFENNLTVARFHVLVPA